MRDLEKIRKAKLTDLELCMLTELSEKIYGWSPWELWRSEIDNPRQVLNRLYIKGLVLIDEAGHYHSIES